MFYVRRALEHKSDEIRKSDSGLYSSKWKYRRYKVLMGEPFKSVGSITTLFKDDMSTAKQIMEIVNQIKRNSEEIA